MLLVVKCAHVSSTDLEILESLKMTDKIDIFFLCQCL